jgi:hypothetical protein
LALTARSGGLFWNLLTEVFTYCRFSEQNSDCLNVIRSETQQVEVLKSDLWYSSSVREKKEKRTKRTLPEALKTRECGVRILSLSSENEEMTQDADLLSVNNPTNAMCFGHVHFPPKLGTSHKMIRFMKKCSLLKQSEMTLSLNKHCRNGLCEI